MGFARPTRRWVNLPQGFYLAHTAGRGCGLLHRERIMNAGGVGSQAPAPEAPTPISPALLKPRPRSPPRTTPEKAETPVMLSPAILKKRDKSLDPATPPNKEPLTRSPVSPADAPTASDSDMPDKVACPAMLPEAASV